MKASHHSYFEQSSAPSWLVPLILLALLFAAVPVLLMSAIAFGAELQPGAAREEALLAGPGPGPCVALAGRGDFAGGMDALGNPVVPAEGPDAHPQVQIPGETVLVRRHGLEIPVQVRGLNAALASSNACGAATALPKAPAHP